MGFFERRAERKQKREYEERTEFRKTFLPYPSADMVGEIKERLSEHGFKTEESIITIPSKTIPYTLYRKHQNTSGYERIVFVFLKNFLPFSKAEKKLFLKEVERFVKKEEDPEWLNRGIQDILHVCIFVETDYMSEELALFCSENTFYPAMYFMEIPSTIYAVLETSSNGMYICDLDDDEEYKEIFGVYTGFNEL